MSVDALRYVSELRDITPAEKGLMYQLADYMSPEGICCPDIHTICDRFKTSQSTVLRLLDGLKRKGLLDWKQNRGRSQNYRFPKMSRPAAQ